MWTKKVEIIKADNGYVIACYTYAVKSPLEVSGPKGTRQPIREWQPSTQDRTIIPTDWATASAMAQEFMEREW